MAGLSRRMGARTRGCCCAPQRRGGCGGPGAGARARAQAARRGAWCGAAMGDGGLRRRRGSGGGSHWDKDGWMPRGAANGEGAALRAPLLAGDEQAGDEQAGGEADNSQREQQVWTALLRALVAGWRKILDAVTNVSAVVVKRGGSGFGGKDKGRGGKPLVLGALAAGRLRGLVARSAVMFDGENPEHRAALARLWTAAFPRDLPSDGGPSERWKDMGWQGKDPATDFRGGGVMGLDNLLGLHQHFPQAFSALLNKSRGTRASIEYPFAVAGVNITFALMSMLGLRDPALVAALAGGNTDNGAAVGASETPAEPGGAVIPAHATSPELHAFAEQLSVHGAHGARAFDSLYAFTFEALDAVWLETKASYMDFGVTLAAATQATKQALGTGDYEAKSRALSFTDIVKG